MYTRKSVSENSDVLFRLLLIVRAWRKKLDQEIIFSGLTDATWRPLMHLLMLGDGVSQKDLAESMGVKGPTLVRLIDTLVVKKLIERRVDKYDRRARKIFLTCQGSDLAYRVFKRVQEINEEVLGYLSAEKNETLLEAISIMEHKLTCNHNNFTF